MPKYSIVIPTYNHFEDCLRPAVDSILKYTTLNDFSTELIIVANGCTDGTKDYIKDLQSKFHGIVLLWFDEAIGFTRATNEGIKISRGDYIITFNNDNILLDQQYNDWLNILVAPFEQKDRKVGMTGPMKEHCPHADRDFLLFFLSMISREALEKVGLLDEIFSPGYGEDTDFCARVADAGFELVQVPDESRMFYDTNRRTGVFPIYHAGNKTFANWPGGEALLAKNNKILEERYRGEPKLGELTRDEIINNPKIAKARACDGFMSEAELLWLAEQAAKAKTVIEIGSWHGRSSRALADNLPDNGRLFCVDHWAGSAVERNTNHQSAAWNDGDHAFLEFSDNLSDHIQSGKVIPVRMSSKNASAWFKKQGIKADLIFIDAGHTYEEVKEDIGLWKDVVFENGILSGHDYNYTDGMWAGVTQAVDEAFNLPTIQQEDTNIWAIKPNEAIPLVNSGGIPNVMNKLNIYDCFPFFNELDVLDIRFAEMYDVVDRFVIVEAAITHGNKPKPLYFQENLARYEKYLNKVTHIVVSEDEFPARDSWSIERHQRDQIMRGLTDCKDNDMIIISDADEIPRASKVYEFDYSKGIMGFQQTLYYYKLNCEAADKWNEAKIATYKNVKEKTPCGIRYWPTTGDSLLKNGGWHFSYLADINGIKNKIEATAHQEYNTEEMKDLSRIEKVVNEGKDLYGRPLQYHFVEVDETYPQYVLANLNKYVLNGLVQPMEVVSN
jgi:beta-1,4-mannosyl-glycoprotein beta-1,4-N-acetylglucosaminyltransferase